jgi:Brp/Blh family beta-carotene 15,15'-monooxygenase
MTADTVPLSAETRLGDRTASERALPPAFALPHREALYRVPRYVGVVAVTVLLVTALVLPSAVAHAALGIAVAGALLGLPHGAVDHVVPAWLARRPLPQRSLAALLTGYLAVVAAGAAALRLAPSGTLVVFLAVAVWHFGRGEVAAAAEAAGRPVPGPGEELLTTLAHGLVPVLLPLLVHPRLSRPVLAALAPGLPPPAAWLRASAAAAVVVIAAAAALRLVAGGRRVEAGELVLLTAAFAIVHPFAVFGVYFGLWHALRHTARLVDLAAADETVRIGVRRFARQAALPTAGALAVLGGVLVTARLAGASASGGSSLLAAELATLAALTFPHSGVVALLDESRRRAVGTTVGDG